MAWFAFSLLTTTSPARILFGGGLLGAPGLLDRIRHHAERMAGGYLASSGAVRDIMRPPVLGNDAGLLDALTLAAGGR